MLIDCFIFYNELDLLNYRLNILYDKVDYFVIVESTKTFQGSDKNLYYNENKELFQNFKDKIIHVIVDDLKCPLNYKEIWDNEHYQRNCIDKGIQRLNLKDDDLIMIADVDEIPNPLKIKDFKINGLLEYDLYYYNLYTKNKNKWFTSCFIDYYTYKSKFNCKPQSIRTYPDFENKNEKAGWHLSYFGDENFIKNKLQSFSHREYNNDYYTNLESIKNKIKESKDLFNRHSEPWDKIEINNNDNLPYKYDEFLQKYF
jgi:beta-1,4-mannosyl-glycoprotein beta-1,4-N-acetylglucosaminyltransferase